VVSGEMNLNKAQREEIRMMFGGKCAYCGIELNGKWHVDHVESVLRDGRWVPTGTGFAKWKQNGVLLRPENDRRDNLYPSCVKCNILKANGNVEDFRHSLNYFAESIPRIVTYSHVHHLMRFGKLTIDTSPVVFHFEKVLAEKEKANEAITIETENILAAQDATPQA
jgi:hypothetical protein